MGRGRGRNLDVSKSCDALSLNPEKYHMMAGFLGPNVGALAVTNVTWHFPDSSYNEAAAPRGPVRISGRLQTAAKFDFPGKRSAGSLEFAHAPQKVQRRYFNGITVGYIGFKAEFLGGRDTQRDLLEPCS